MTKAIIRIVAAMDGRPCIYAGEWLKTFGPEDFDGRGLIETTRDKADAMVFADYPSAFAFWKIIPKNRPTRADGKPNRPLTAYMIEIEPAP